MLRLDMNTGARTRHFPDGFREDVGETAAVFAATALTFSPRPSTSSTRAQGPARSFRVNYEVWPRRRDSPLLPVRPPRALPS